MRTYKPGLPVHHSFLSSCCQLRNGPGRMHARPANSTQSCALQPAGACRPFQGLLRQKPSCFCSGLAMVEASRKRPFFPKMKTCSPCSLEQLPAAAAAAAAAASCMLNSSLDSPLPRSTNQPSGFSDHCKLTKGNNGASTNDTSCHPVRPGCIARWGSCRCRPPASS